MICLNLNAEMNYRKFFKNLKGKQEFNKQNFEEAEAQFRENTIENPNIGQFHFNRGNALYKMENFEEAQREYQIALNDRNFKDKDKIYHNLGNIAYNTNQFTDALDLYRRSLIENPNNEDSRKNYELTRLLLTPQSESEQQENDDQDGDGDNEQQQQTAPVKESEDQNEAERMLQALEQKQEQEKEEQPKRPGRKTGNFW
jgi:tetratricopeptide (TPR) repeat protein